MSIFSNAVPSSKKAVCLHGESEVDVLTGVFIMGIDY